MANTGKRAAMTTAGLVCFGLAIAAATQAQACFDWGYSGTFSHGWAYANTGFSSYPALSYRSCGGVYHIPGWGECGGYGPCGWAPLSAPVVAVPATDAAAPAERAVAIRRPVQQR
jgi:hypothetical protein